MLNLERKIIEVNESLCKMLGYSQDEMLGKTLSNFVNKVSSWVLVSVLWM
jgi:PAS domain S-box-containing protein